MCKRLVQGDGKAISACQGRVRIKVVAAVTSISAKVPAPQTMREVKVECFLNGWVQGIRVLLGTAQNLDELLCFSRSIVSQADRTLGEDGFADGDATLFALSQKQTIFEAGIDHVPAPLITHMELCPESFAEQGTNGDLFEGTT